MTKMYSEMQNGFKQVYSEMRQGFKEVNARIDKVETRLENVEKTVVHIENDHGKKLGALFDGYKQNSEKLDRIEKEVSKHEEIITKRVR